MAVFGGGGNSGGDNGEKTKESENGKLWICYKCPLSRNGAVHKR